MYVASRIFDGLGPGNAFSPSDRQDPFADRFAGRSFSSGWLSSCMHRHTPLLFDLPPKPMKNSHALRHGAALAALAVAALLAGCKGDVLDYRNAQMVNDKVYDGNANEPFSGKLTNVPDRSLLIEQAGFQLTGKLASIALADSVPAAESNAQSFLGSSGAETLLSGAVCDVQINGGVPDGPAVCKAPQSEVVRIETSFKHGTLDGSAKAMAPFWRSHSATASPTVQKRYTAGPITNSSIAFPGTRASRRAPRRRLIRIPAHSSSAQRSSTGNTREKSSTMPLTASRSRSERPTSTASSTGLTRSGIRAACLSRTRSARMGWKSVPTARMSARA